jgi:hypothetical protein
MGPDVRKKALEMVMNYDGDPCVLSCATRPTEKPSVGFPCLYGVGRAMGFLEAGYHNAVL